MRAIVLLAVLAAGLGACNKKPADASGWWGLFSNPEAHGRYSGVGVYSPGDGWQRLVTRTSEGSSAAARNTDDEAVIVVVDSQTGELRACGDVSGYCVGFNPWERPLPKGQTAPVDLRPRPKPQPDPAPADTSNTR